MGCLAVSHTDAKDVRDHGETALIGHAVRLGDIKVPLSQPFSCQDGEPLTVGPEGLKAAFEALAPELQSNPFFIAVP